MALCFLVRSFLRILRKLFLDFLTLIARRHAACPYCIPADQLCTLRRAQVLLSWNFNVIMKIILQQQAFNNHLQI